MKANKIALDQDTSFAFIASMQLAVEFKEKGKSKKDFITWFEEIWNSMEMNSIDSLKKTIQERMMSDLMQYTRKNG